MCLALLLGSLSFHAHGLGVAEADGLAGRTVAAAAEHPAVPHHIEASELVQERGCPACFSNTHSGGVPAHHVAAAPQRSSILLTSRDIVTSDRAVGAFSARGPPTT